jgi:hypothetical protein
VRLSTTTVKYSFFHFLFNRQISGIIKTKKNTIKNLWHYKLTKSKPQNKNLSKDNATGSPSNVTEKNVGPQAHQQLKDEPLAYSKLQNTKVRQPLRQAQKCNGWV